LFATSRPRRDRNHRLAVRFNAIGGGIEDQAT
jgi:hypothetical protein